MLNIYAHCSLWGEEFSPAKAERNSGMPFDEKSEPGEIATFGRFRGQPLPYGSAKLILREGGERGKLIDPEIISFVAKNLHHFRKAGATDIQIDIVVAYGGQCNLEMSPEFLNSVASLGIPLTLSCYEDETLRED
ncbi:MAG: hypothetical protein HY913_18920 [Desulfomonile tiedjei]|nr:hypothetical protein [Desulfomonile tiedjei]